MVDPSKDGRGGLLIAGLKQDFFSHQCDRANLSSIGSIFAAGQQQALQAARRRRLALAVVNRELADGDGLRLTSLLKEIAPDLRVIVTGAGCDPEEELEAYASGASLYLPHPVDDSLLAQVIVSCLDQASKSKPLETSVA